MSISPRPMIPPRLLATVNIAWARLRTRGVRDTWLDVYGTSFVSQANEILRRAYDCYLSSLSNVCRLFVRWKIGLQHGDCNIGVCRRTIWSPTEHWVLPDPNRSIQSPRESTLTSLVYSCMVYSCPLEVAGRFAPCSRCFRRPIGTGREPSSWTWTPIQPILKHSHFNRVLFLLFYCSWPGCE